MSTITVPSSLISIRTKEPLSPAMRATVWEIGAALDEARIRSGHHEPVWLSIPTRRLRGEGARSDNAHLKTTLDRLCGVYLTGEHKGDEWGAVLLAEWHLEQVGSIARLFVPPAAVAAIQTPKTFAKIESRAAHAPTRHGRQLYVLLADRKNQHQKHWTYTVDELRALMGCEDKTAYQVWAQFNKRVLQPALEQVNDFGTVSVRMTTKRLGRAVNWVRFDWVWKDPHEAAETVLENERHSKSRRKQQDDCEAPPLTDVEISEQSVSVAERWWSKLSDIDRQNFDAKFRMGEFEMPNGKKQRFTRRDADMISAAFKNRTSDGC